MPQRGFALIFTLVLVLIATMASVTLMMVTRSEQHVVTEQVALAQLRQMCATGEARAAADLEVGGSGNLSFFFNGGTITTQAEEVDGLIRVTTFAAWSDEELWTRVWLRSVHPAFEYTVYQGNGSGSGTAELLFRGDDYVGSGGVHANNPVVFTDGATKAPEVTVTSSASVSGVSGTVVPHIAPPDLSASDYATHNDVNINQQLTDHGTLQVRLRAGTGLLGVVDFTDPSSIGGMLTGLLPTDLVIEQIIPASEAGHWIKREWLPINDLVSVEQGVLDLNAGLDLSADSYVSWYVVEDSHEANPGELSPLTEHLDSVFYLDTGGDPLVFFNPEADRLQMATAGVGLTLVVHGGNVIFDDEFGTADPLDAIGVIAQADPVTGTGGNIQLGTDEDGVPAQLQGLVLYAEDELRIARESDDGPTSVTFTGTFGAGEQVVEGISEVSIFDLLGLGGLLDEGTVLGGLELLEPPLDFLFGGGTTEVEAVTFSAPPSGSTLPFGLPSGGIGTVQALRTVGWQELTTQPGD